MTVGLYVEYTKVSQNPEKAIKWGKNMPTEQ
jgi:hypothetical protein